MRYILLFLLLTNCGEINKEGIKDLKKLGYKEFTCTQIDYRDYKADISDHPYYKVYDSVEKKNPDVDILLARCFEEDYCEYEMIQTNEIICQKFFIKGEESFTKYWDDHTILAFNLKN
tara:strand:- start:1122 stop:1475 length:354 start_codon:yes stop_codon:yes gene_type:complete